MIKYFFERGKIDPILVVHRTTPASESDENRKEVVKLNNSEVLANLEAKLRVTPIESKIQDIIQYPTPTNERRMRRFGGMVGYYRKFLKNFSDVGLPLMCLLKKKAMFN